MHMRGKSRFFNGNVLSPSTKNLLDGHSVFRKNYGIEKFSALVGDFTTFCGNFSVPFWWKRSSRNTSVFEKFSDIGKISGYWGRVSQFSDESYNIWVLKTFVDENFCVSEVFPYRKRLRLRGWYHVFLSELVWLLLPEKIVEVPFSVLKTTDFEKLYAKQGKSPFLSEIFCLTVPQN